MAIVRQMMEGRRLLVACFGESLSSEAQDVFVSRGFAVESFADLNAFHQRGGFAAVACVVIAQTANNAQTALFRDVAAPALDHDCRVIARTTVSRRAALGDEIVALGLPSALPPHSDATSPSIDEGIPPLPYVWLYPDSIAWTEAANLLLEYPAGHAPNLALEILGLAPGKLDTSQSVLVRRAFHNCSRVTLIPLDGGKSGAGVYKAYAEPKLPDLGPSWPIPYFVKIGSRSAVFAEYQNYQEKVDPYVPFHLGPNLLADRCCLGAKSGIIVGDFVDQSESLVECAKAGRAGPSIACLFDRSLYGWYLCAKVANADTAEIRSSLSNAFPRKIPKKRLARARELGAERRIEQLRELFDQRISQPVRVGPIHGDLHASNVLVRDADAIIIDFCAHRRGPLVYDAACLEASLLVDGLGSSKELSLKGPELLAILQPLYDRPELCAPIMIPDPSLPTAWFNRCIDQIRLYGHRMECADGQYASALAVALLRKAAKDPAVPEPGSMCRAIAYRLAEILLVRGLPAATNAA